MTEQDATGDNASATTEENWRLDGMITGTYLIQYPNLIWHPPNFSLNRQVSISLFLQFFARKEIYNPTNGL